MTAIRIARSFVAAESVAELIAAEYDVASPVSCRLFSKLLRTQDNDHYLATAGDGTQYAFRVYQQGDRYHRAESDYLYEIDWLRFLREHELPVSYPIRRRDGGYIGRIDAPEGTRYYALFSLAYGDPLALKGHRPALRHGRDDGPHPHRFRYLHLAPRPQAAGHGLPARPAAGAHPPHLDRRAGGQPRPGADRGRGSARRVARLHRRQHRRSRPLGANRR
jgi:hypothetical protein